MKKPPPKKLQEHDPVTPGTPPSSPPTAPGQPEPEGLGTRIARRFAGIGPTEPIEECPRQIARPAAFPDGPDQKSSYHQVI